MFAVFIDRAYRDRGLNGFENDTVDKIISDKETKRTGYNG